MDSGTRISDLPDDTFVEEKKVPAVSTKTKTSTATKGSPSLLAKITNNVDWASGSVVAVAAFAGQTVPIDVFTSKFPVILSMGAIPLRSLLVVILFFVMKAFFCGTAQPS